MTKKSDIIQSSGKRKTAIARATLRKGKGRLTVNKTPISLFRPEIYALRIKEPLILAGNLSKNVFN